jgi:hypothetical protein
MRVDGRGDADEPVHRGADQVRGAAAEAGLGVPELYRKYEVVFQSPTIEANQGPEGLAETLDVDRSRARSSCATVRGPREFLGTPAGRSTR